MVKTYNEWKLAGRYVSKGSKAIGFNEDGLALFNLTQTVQKSKSPYYGNYGGSCNYDHDYDYEDCWSHCYF